MKKNSLTFILLFLSIVSFSQTNNLIWAKAMGGTSANSASSVKVDASGNVYTVGFFSGTTDFDPGPGTFTMTAFGFDDIFVSKLDVNGNFLWAKKIGGTSYENANSVAVDGSGNVYLCGHFEGTCDFDPGVGTFNLISNGGRDIFISKLDASGNFLWAKSMGGFDDEGASSIDLDATGNAYFIGSFNGTVDFDPGIGTFTLACTANGDAFISKLDALGNFVFAKQLQSDDNCYGYSIELDALGNIHACGFFEAAVIDLDPGVGTYTVASISGSADIFVLKLNTNGSFIWAKTMGGSGYEEAVDLAVDGLGNVYTSGYFEDICDFDPGVGTFTLNATGNLSEIFISKLDASGNFVWAKQFNGISDDECFSITTDALNNVYTTGYFESICDFDPGVGTFTLAATGQSDIFISKLDAAGNFVFADRIGAGLSDRGNSIQVDAAGNVYTVGEFIGNPVDFDTGIGTYTLGSGANQGAFVHKMCMAPSAPTDVTPSANQVICSPNNSTTLMANGNGIINWYATPTSTLSLGTGTTFATPNLAVGSYTYYAEAGTCTTSITRTAISFTISACTGLANEFQKELNVINLYPNPNNGNFSVDVKEPCKLTVTDATGRVILQQELTTGKNTIDIVDRADGIYFIAIQTNTQLNYFKIIKCKM